MALFSKPTPSAEKPDLTTPENFAKGQEVYGRMVRGEITDVTAELHRVYGTTPAE
ncbi:hypothetical protein ACWGDX_13230 [Streptomyces sp. NPDC055025]